MTPCSPTGGASDAFDAAVSGYYSPLQWRAITQTRVGIAGAGGLGSNIAVALVRSGFRHFEIADFDVVEARNLNRQYYFLDDTGLPKVEALARRLRAVNPVADVRAHQVRLTEANITQYFQEADYLIEAFDQPEAKRMFLEAFLGSGKCLVMGSGMAGIANEPRIEIRQWKENVYLVGDGVTAVSAANPPCAPRVAVCAGLMASVVLERVANPPC